MWRLLIFIVVFLSFATLNAQNVIAELDTNGKFVVLEENNDTSLVSDENSFKVKLGDEGGRFVILNNGTPGIDEYVKFLIRESGEVNWYLDGEEMFIRESNFEYEPGKFGTYDYFFVDGNNGRMGFNVLSNTLGGVDDNLPLTSSVNLFGSIATRVRAVDGATNYVIKQDDHIMIIDKQDNGTNEMVLPSVSNSKGRELYFKRNGFNDGQIVVKPQPGEKFNGEEDLSIDLSRDNASMMVVCDGDSWWVITEITAASVTRLTIDATTSLTVEDVIEVNFTTANQSIDIELPPVDNFEGKRYEIKRNANGNTFTGNILRILPQATGAEELDHYTNANPYLMTNNYESVTVESNGTQWLIVNNYNADEALVTVAANYTPYRNDKTILINGPFIVTLPDATTLPVGKTYTLKRINSGGSSSAPTVATMSGQTIDGLTSVLLNRLSDYIVVQNDGSNWQTVSERISPSFVNNPSLPYTVSAYDGTISSNQTGTVNLPNTASVIRGMIFVIKNSSTGANTTLTVDPFGSQTIDGLTTVALANGEFISIQSTGSSWIIIGQ